MSDSSERTESFPPVPVSENVAESSLIATAELAAGLAAESEDATEPEQGIWSAIRESIRGSHRDYTIGPIGRAVILLAIPMVLEMFMESLFAVADIRSEEHTSELQSQSNLVCRLLLEKKKTHTTDMHSPNN